MTERKLSPHITWIVVGVLCFINGMWVTKVVWQQGLYPFVGGAFIALGIGLILNKRL